MGDVCVEARRLTPRGAARRAGRRGGRVRLQGARGEWEERGGEGPRGREEQGGGCEPVGGGWVGGGRVVVAVGPLAWLVLACGEMPRGGCARRVARDVGVTRDVAVRGGQPGMPGCRAGSPRSAGNSPDGCRGPSRDAWACRSPADRAHRSRVELAENDGHLRASRSGEIRNTRWWSSAIREYTSYPLCGWFELIVAGARRLGRGIDLVGISASSGETTRVGTCPRHGSPVSRPPKYTADLPNP